MSSFFNINMRYTLYFLIICICIFLLIYASLNTSKKWRNCLRIKKNNKKKVNIGLFSNLNTPIGDLNIKTAYNCCCSGTFKNDYVDLCALDNCAYYGVRALDFQIYSLKGSPVISASSVNAIKYKEMYNELPFNDTMIHIKKKFLRDTTLVNRNEPLFLIFRIYSKNKNTYDKVYDSLNNVFGTGNKTGSVIYITSTLNTDTFSQLKNKVIILVESNTGNRDNSRIETSSLFRISSINFNDSTKGRIYRESDILDTESCDILNTTINAVYPNRQTNSYNYDYTQCARNKNVHFIGLNFQKNDMYLDSFTSNAKTNGTQGFGSYAFKEQPSQKIKENCDKKHNNQFNDLKRDIMTKVDRRINKHKLVEHA